MKENKNLDALTNLVKDTANLGKKAAKNAKAGVIAIAKKSKENEHAKKIKKYNPLFIEKFRSDDFDIPDIVVIVDDAVRRDVDVCKGAIGWLGKEAGEEVLLNIQSACTKRLWSKLSL